MIFCIFFEIHLNLYIKIYIYTLKVFPFKKYVKKKYIYTLKVFPFKKCVKKNHIYILKVFPFNKFVKKNKKKSIMSDNKNRQGNFFKKNPSRKGFINYITPRYMVWNPATIFIFLSNIYLKYHWFLDSLMVPFNIC